MACLRVWQSFELILPLKIVWKNNHFDSRVLDPIFTHCHISQFSNSSKCFGIFCRYFHKFQGIKTMFYICFSWFCPNDIFFHELVMQNWSTKCFWFINIVDIRKLNSIFRAALSWELAPSINNSMNYLKEGTNRECICKIRF